MAEQARFTPWRERAFNIASRRKLLSADQCAQEIEALVQEAQSDLLAALQGYMHAMEGFADAVRADTGTAYPWEAQDIEREKARAALSKALGQ